MANEGAAAPPLAALVGAKIVKRSIAIAGHRTSVSLEEIFWGALKSMAAARGLSIAALVAEIDAGRRGANLSSAIRVFVLETLLARQ
jgi:predicted DNA-binding ribbon-helix-helix protein